MGTKSKLLSIASALVFCGVAGVANAQVTVAPPTGTRVESVASYPVQNDRMERRAERREHRKEKRAERHQRRIARRGNRMERRGERLEKRGERLEHRAAFEK